MAIDYPYAEACKNYLKNDKKNQAENWAAYASRIEALKLLETPLVKEVNSVYFGTTKTMMIKWWRLEEMEKDTYLKIICGKDSVSSFDQFVKAYFISCIETANGHLSIRCKCACRLRCRGRCERHARHAQYHYHSND